MSKIEEMAYRDLLVKSRVVGGVMFDENEGERIGYMLGAKAVLEEIEKALDLGEPPYLISVEQAYYRAEKLIRELKDE